MSTNMIVKLVAGVWNVWADMAPYLIFGFCVAGIMSAWLSGAWVHRQLGGGGVGAAIRAAALGIPLPLCSCSVIPIAASLRRQGASRGATASFLMATPQVGVNSLILSWGIMGPVITTARAVAAFISGLLCGALIDLFDRKSEVNKLALEAYAHNANDADDLEAPAMPVWQQMLHHAFVALPRDIARPIFIGVIISAVFTVWLPPGFFAELVAPGFPAMLLMMLIGIPVYVCSTSSIPVAMALIYAGIQPGAALVFLITGPAINAATLAAIYRLLGARATLIFVVVLAITALTLGWGLDNWLLERIPALAPSGQIGHDSSWMHHVAGLALIVVLLVPLTQTCWRQLVSRKQ